MDANATRRTLQGTTFNASVEPQASHSSQNTTQNEVTDPLFGSVECKNALLDEFPKLNIIDRSVWERYVWMPGYDFNFEDFQPVAFSTIQKVLRAIDFSQIDQDAGVTIGILPQNLSVEKVMDVALRISDPIAMISSFLYWQGAHLSHFGADSLKQSQLIVLTNSLIKGTAGENSSIHTQRLIETRFEIPQVLPMAAFAVLNYANSKTRFYNFGEAYTRCVETVDNASVITGRTPQRGSTIFMANQESKYKTVGIGGMLVISPKNLQSYL